MWSLQGSNSRRATVEVGVLAMSLPNFPSRNYVNQFKWQNVFFLNKIKVKTKQNKKLLQGKDQMTGTIHSFLTLYRSGDPSRIFWHSFASNYTASLPMNTCPWIHLHYEDHVFLSLACKVSNIPNGEPRERKKGLSGLITWLCFLLLWRLSFKNISKMDPVLNVMVFH